MERLRTSTDGAGRQIQRQIDLATALKDDLTFLIQRGEGLADRIADLVRDARPMATAEPKMAGAYETRTPEPAVDTRVRSQAERDLLKALRLAR